MYKFTHKPLLKNDAQLKFKKWQKKKKGNHINLLKKKKKNHAQKKKSKKKKQKKIRREKPVSHLRKREKKEQPIDLYPGNEKRKCKSSQHPHLGNQKK